MRKTIVVITCLLMLVFGTCYATDTTDLLEKYQEMSYITDAGINRLDYNKEYRKLYIETQKAKDKLDASIYMNPLLPY